MLEQSAIINVDFDIDKYIENYEIEKNTLFEEIKRNISLTDNEYFFKSELDEDGNNVVKIIDTGIGKTYQSCYLALYTLFYTNNKVLISTTKNENVSDLKREFLKILNQKIENKTDNIREFLNNPDLEILKIATVNSVSNYTKESIIDSRIIITNHSYLFQFGHSHELRKNTKLILNHFTENDIILIDEVDEFEKQAIINIPLNRFMKKSCTMDKKKIFKYADCFLKSNEYKYYEQHKEECRYKTAKEIKKFLYDLIGEYNEPLYRVDEFERPQSIDLLKIIDSNFRTVEILKDIGRREGFEFTSKNNENLNILRISLIKVLEFNAENERILEELDIKNDFISLLKNSHGNWLVEDIIQITRKEKDEEGNVINQILIEEFENFNDFIEWIKENASIETYDKNIFPKLLKVGKLLYRKNLLVRRKGVLPVLRGKKYLFTATHSNLNKLGYSLNKENHKSRTKIEKIDIFFVEQEKNLDKTIASKALNCFVDKDINVLAFLAEQRNLKEYCLNSDTLDNNKYKNVKVVTSVKTKDNDIKSHVVALGEKTKYLNKKENVTISYLNGTESTGKNYCETDLLIINTKCVLNILGRADINGKINSITDLEDYSLKITIQACGRIERVLSENTKYKAIIMYGDSKSIVRKFVKAKEGNEINYRVYFESNFNKIIDCIERRVKKYNLGMDENINVDSRKKFNSDEIIKLYLDLVSSETTEKEAKKMTINKFAINRPYLNKILKLYSDKL